MTPGMRRPRIWIAVALAIVPAVVIPIGAVATSGGTPSFTRSVAPVIAEKCAGCHQIGGIAPFPLETSKQIAARSSAIGAAVQAGVMPPWPPGKRSPAYVGQAARTLTGQQRAAIVVWAAKGGKVDGPARKPAAPQRPEVRTGEQVLSLRMPTAYRPSAAKGATDDYRCFLLDPKQVADGSVTSVRIDPGQPKVVHHVILFRAAPGLVDDAKRLDTGSAGPGWSCFGGSGLPAGDAGGFAESLNDANWIAAWAPGWGGNRLPDGTGVELPAGSQIVMQVHYNLLNGRGPDRSRAVLTVAPASAGLKPLETMLLPGPVELACAKAEQATTLCDRNEALFDLARKYGTGSAFTPAGLLILCRGNAANPVASAVSTCDRRISTTTTIHVAAGHMHLLGAAVKVELNPGTSRAKVLLDIPRWDFHWQNAYTLVRPVVAQPGDVVRVTCRHDVGKRRDAVGIPRAPRYVLWGEGTTDEMCLGILQVTRG